MSILVGLALAAPAYGTSLSWHLTSTNGEGTYDPTIACPAGDGPSWRYAYSGLASTSGPLGGTWNSTIEAHDAGGNNAFIPPGTGRIKITADRGGEANLEFGNGSCAFAPLSLGTEVDGDPAVSGSQPATATGGSGTLAGFIGSGVVTLSNIELGPGADNVADVSISGDFTINQPHMVLGTPQPYWRNLNDYLHHRLTMTVPLRNLGDPPANGDAYAVNLTKARLSARVPLSGVPAPLGRIDAGKAKTTAVTFPNVQANKTYTLKVWIDGTDALDDPFPTVIDSTAVKAPPPP